MVYMLIAHLYQFRSKENSYRWKWNSLYLVVWYILFIAKQQTLAFIYENRIWKPEFKGVFFTYNSVCHLYQRFVRILDFKKEYLKMVNCLQSCDGNIIKNKYSRKF